MVHLVSCSHPMYMQTHTPSHVTLWHITVFEGIMEYSCKLFAPRKEKLQLETDGEGPLVSFFYNLALLVLLVRYREQKRSATQL